MKKNIYTKKTKAKLKLLFITMLMLISNLLFADGSKDLYPNGVLGGRAFLYSNSYTGTTGTTMGSWPFKSAGTHYAYVRAGEILHVASSAQGMGNGRIELTAPDGTVYTSANNTTGQIGNRTAELAGPRLLSQGTGGNRYSTFNRTAASNQAGIWKIEFTPTGDVSSSSTPSVANVAANANWTQANNSELIAAWDVSVESSGSWVSGRVYTNVINLHISSNQTTGFNGNMFALTKDGYIYRVGNNGNNGVGFTFFVNNNGFFTDTNNNIPAYKSKNFSNGISSYVHSPLAADTTQNITHKIFYSQPASDLPASANGSVPGGNTWLKNIITAPNATNINVVGVENTLGQIGSKGGFINFTAGTQGSYTIIIESTSMPAGFVTRTLTGTAVAGNNSILWDGKDGNNNPLQAGNQSIKITVQLRGAEVHFPFIDMEINPNGMVLELLNGTDLSDERFRVYWDDNDIIRTAGDNDQGKAPNPISANLIGSLSGPTGTGGHMWGQQTGNTNPLSSTDLSTGFGNNRSIDTWSYIKGAAVQVNTSVVIKIADLKITEVTPNLTTVGIGDNLTYTVKVKNDGPSDVTGSPFTFALPIGLDPQSLAFSGNGCGTESVAITYNSTTRKYSSQLDLPNGCEITYAFTTKANAAATPGNLEVKATILRPNDVTDPDATNPNPAVPPTDAEYECTNNGLGGSCNNILKNNVTVFSPGTICTEPVNGNAFQWSQSNGASPVTQFITQPASNYGFVFDIYELDNSFNLNINGTLIATQELQFQSSGTSGINVRFADGDQYEIHTTHNGSQADVWEMRGNAANPLIRVSISPSGEISLFGSKTSYGPLFPLVLTNGNTFNTITWNHSATNNITVTQNVVGVTVMDGYGYGLNIIPCAPVEVCTKPVTGNDFYWSYNASGDPTSPNGSQVQEIITQPGSNYGFVIDIYGLDNSFNMNINGTALTTQEVQFWSGGGQNIRFKSDQSQYEFGGNSAIWMISGNASSPSIRVKISPSGVATFYGKRTTNSALEELELFNGNTLNPVIWNAAANNTITVGQTVEGATRMSGSGYGLNTTPCTPCTKPGTAGTPDSYTKVGILTKKSITNSTTNGSVTTNWPENVPNGHIVLDSDSRGLVITHMTTAQRDALIAVDGMIIYNTDLGCVQLYRGNSPGVDWSRTGWNCLEKGCNE